MTKSEVDHLDVRRLVVPLWAAVTVLVSMVISTASVVGIYFTMMAKIDDMQRNVTSLVIAVERVTATAEAALTARDLDNWCLKAQIANANWKCPVVGADGLVLTPGPRPPQPRTTIRPRPTEIKSH